MDRREGSDSAGAGAFPDDVTRPAGEVADFEVGASSRWRCTVVWHPDPARIGAVAHLPSAGAPLLFGRGEPVFDTAIAGSSGANSRGARKPGDGRQSLADPHVSRRAFQLQATAKGWRIERLPGSSRLRLAGREISAAEDLTDDAARRGFVLALAMQRVQASWLSEPLRSWRSAAMTFSLAKPLNASEIDRRETFQFTLGRGF